MFLIFSHLVRNAIRAIKRLLLQPKNIGIATSLALLVVVASSLWSHSAAVRTATQQDERDSSTATQKLHNSNVQKSVPAQTDPTQDSDLPDSSSSQNAKNASPSASAPATSATPTQSFSTSITRAGQVAPGTLISYSAPKNEKTYYGGDLILNVTSITISKSNTSPDARSVTVSSPDGQTIGVPSASWDDKSPYFWVATDSSSAKASGVSFTMFVDFASNVPNGTYQLHLTSGRAAQTADGWRYDGFITITVVD